MHSNTQEARRYRVFLVDDEQDITYSLKKGLENEGFEVEAFTSPVIALRNYKPGTYDLALLDIRMPEMSGFELFRKIKEMDGKIRVCFITAFEIYYDEFRRVFPKLKVKCFVRKPVSISVLARVIKEEIEWREEIIRAEAPMEQTKGRSSLDKQAVVKIK